MKISGNFILWALAVVTLIVLNVDYTESVCCFCPSLEDPFTSYCSDGARCSPCCGFEGCNTFCCNCSPRYGKYCRSGNDGRSDYNGVGPDPGFLQLDKNGDNFVDKKELEMHLRSGACGNSSKVDKLDEIFAEVDHDGNGMLDETEVNSPTSIPA